MSEVQKILEQLGEAYHNSYPDPKAHQEAEQLSRWSDK